MRKVFLILCWSFASLLAADFSPSADEKESYDALKKDVIAMVKNISDAACKKDTVGVLQYHLQQREKWRFTSWDELRPYIEKKYGREVTEKDAEEEALRMRKAWRKYFEALRDDIAKGKGSSLCGAKFVSFQGNPLLGTIAAKIKLGNDDSDMWDVMLREPDRPDQGAPMMVIDLDGKSRSLMKKYFPYVKFSAQMIAESNNP